MMNDKKTILKNMIYGALGLVYAIFVLYILYVFFA